MRLKPIQTATKDRTPILGTDGKTVRMIHWWNNGMSWVIIDSGGVPFNPTHWMNVPKFTLKETK